MPGKDSFYFHETEFLAALLPVLIDDLAQAWIINRICQMQFQIGLLAEYKSLGDRRFKGVVLEKGVRNGWYGE